MALECELLSIQDYAGVIGWGNKTLCTLGSSPEVTGAFRRRQSRKDTGVLGECNVTRKQETTALQLKLEHQSRSVEETNHFPTKEEILNWRWLRSGKALRSPSWPKNRTSFTKTKGTCPLRNTAQEHSTLEINLDWQALLTALHWPSLVQTAACTYSTPSFSFCFLPCLKINCCLMKMPQKHLWNLNHLFENYLFFTGLPWIHEINMLINSFVFLLLIWLLK